MYESHWMIPGPKRDNLLDLCSECRKVVEFRGYLLEHGHRLKVKEGVNCLYADHSC